MLIAGEDRVPVLCHIVFQRFTLLHEKPADFEEDAARFDALRLELGLGFEAQGLLVVTVHVKESLIRILLPDVLHDVLPEQQLVSLLILLIVLLVELVVFHEGAHGTISFNDASDDLRDHDDVYADLVEEHLLSDDVHAIMGFGAALFELVIVVHLQHS